MTRVALLDNFDGDDRPFDRFLFKIKDSPANDMSGRQIGFGARFESGWERTFERIDFREKCRLITRSDDQDAKEQGRIERFNFELAFGVRPDALAAIRIAGGSYISRTDARPGGVDENAGIGNGLIFYAENRPGQIGRVGIGVDDEGSEQSENTDPRQPAESFHVVVIALARPWRNGITRPRQGSN